jgi:hypothetical protein
MPVKNAIGRTDTLAAQFGVGFSFVTPFAVDPQTTDHLAAASRDFVFLSDDGGITWARANDRQPNKDGDDSHITAITYAQDLQHTIYVGYSNGKVFRSVDGGSTWSAVYGSRPWGNYWISAIAADPEEPNHVYLTVWLYDTPQVWRSTDAGSTWQNISASNADGTRGANALPNIPALSIAIDHPSSDSNDDPIIYVGNYIGVYQGTLDGGNWSWRRFGTGLPNVQVTDLQLQTYNNTRRLAAATYGRGAWVFTCRPCALHLIFAAFCPKNR